MSFALALILKPLVAVVFFVLVWVIAAAVIALIPDGKLKRLLLTPIAGSKTRSRD
jgi:hypothetical protein